MPTNTKNIIFQFATHTAPKKKPSRRKKGIIDGNKNNLISVRYEFCNGH